jgi:hypothetical protein
MINKTNKKGIDPVQTKTDNASRLGDMVNGYNSMMHDPLKYAQTTYKDQIKFLGRRDPKSSVFLTQTPWDKNDIPG